MHLLRAAALLLAASGPAALAQRPSSSSICDYYASQRYGSSNSTSQFRLMESIVALAFGGGASVPGTDPISTGILNPGTFRGQAINLRSWFDGSSMFFSLGFPHWACLSLCAAVLSWARACVCVWVIASLN